MVVSTEERHASRIVFSCILELGLDMFIGADGYPADDTSETRSLSDGTSNVGLDVTRQAVLILISTHNKFLTFREVRFPKREIRLYRHRRCPQSAQRRNRLRCDTDVADHVE